MRKKGGSLKLKRVLLSGGHGKKEKGAVQHGPKRAKGSPAAHTGDVSGIGF